MPAPPPYGEYQLDHVYYTSPEDYYAYDKLLRFDSLFTFGMIKKHQNQEIKIRYR